MSLGRARIRIREVDDGVDGAPPWITTFVDMVSLLVTFFILLFTFSSVHDYDAFTFPKNLIGNRGIQSEKPRTDLTAPEHDVMQSFDLSRGARVPHSRPTHLLLENMEEMGQRLTDAHVEVDANDVGDGLALRFDERASFAPGSAHVNAVLGRALGELGRTMQHYPHTIVVEGHTDTAFQPTALHPTAEALSLARARAAADVMLAASELPPELVQISGLGATRPLAASDSEGALARRADRRVEVRILAMDRARAHAVEEEGR